jgi:hypothetical protein
VINSQRKSRHLGEKKVRGFVFRSYVGDHPPLHVHVFWRGREIGRWDIEHQRLLDSFPLTRRLSQALSEAGYLAREEER